MIDVFGTNFFQEVLANNFADDRREWDKYAKYIALNFLREYNKNVNFMVYKMENINRKNVDYLSDVEKNQAKVIINFISLRKLIIVDQEENDIALKYDDINNLFIKVTEEKELGAAQEAVRKLDQQTIANSRFYSHPQKNKELGSFQKLQNFYVLLISFVQERDSRREFYLNFVAKDELSQLSNFSPLNRGQSPLSYNDVV